MADSGKERSRSRSPLHLRSNDDETKSTDETEIKDETKVKEETISKDQTKIKDETLSTDKTKSDVTKSDDNNYIYIFAENLPTFPTRKMRYVFKDILGTDRPDKVFFEPIRENGILTGQYVFTFNDENERQKVFKKLQDAKFESKSLNPELDSVKGKSMSRGQLPELCVYKDRENWKPTNIEVLHTKTEVGAKTNIYVKAVPWGVEPAPDHTYGLSVQYLKGLHIEPPLRRKVCVMPIQASVDEVKLREVFGLAGQVTSVRIIPSKSNFEDTKGFIEFDHPVEAVQAISMFNNQKLYGRKLSVKMDHVNARFLPKGLQGIGPGLGTNGEPMKGVRVAMEIKQLERKLEKELTIRETQSNKPEVPENNSNQLLAQLSTLLSNTVQGNIPSQNMANMGLNSSLGQNVPVGQLLVQHLLSNQNPPNLNQNTPNYGHNSNLGPNFNQQSSNFNQNVPDFDQNRSRSGNLNVPIVQSDMAQGSKGSNFMSSGNNQSWNTQPMGMQGGHTGQDRHFTQQNKFDDRREFHVRSNRSDKESGSKRYDNKKPDTLVFSYLPPSVNGQTFNTKMSEVGEIVFGEVTGQGRAIVRFVNPSDADKCIKLFDQSRVDGQIIHVKYL